MDAGDLPGLLGPPGAAQDALGVQAHQINLPPGLEPLDEFGGGADVRL